MNILLRYFGYSVKTQSMVLFTLTHKLEYRWYVEKDVQKVINDYIGLLKHAGWEITHIIDAPLSTQ